MKPLSPPSISISVLALSWLLISPSAAQQTKDIYVTPRLEKELRLGDRYALVIGIGKYKDKRIPALNYTVADAKAMFDVLTDPRHGRFPKAKARLLLDEGASRDAIMRGFTWLRQNAKAGDTVIIFYSGHGAPEEDNTYWVPYDADIDDLFATAVGIDIITGQLSQVRAKRLITFLDSCYSRAIVEKKDKPKALFDQDFFAKFKGEGRVTITASDGKELSLESEDLKQGVFTHYLLEALKGKADKNQDGAVELEEVWEHVRLKVTEEAQKRVSMQRPNLIGQMTAGLLVSLNPGVLEVEKGRLEGLKQLFQKKEITSAEYEEAEKVLGGEGEARILNLVRGLADGRLRASEYRLARLERERDFKRVEGVWRETRTAQLRSGRGNPYTVQSTSTLMLQVEGNAVRGYYDSHTVDTLTPPNYWNDAFTRQSCGNVNGTTVRRYLEGTVSQGGVVSFTTRPAEIIEDNCNTLRKQNPDWVRQTLTITAELSPDGLSLRLSRDWLDYLGGGDVVLKKSD